MYRPIGWKQGRLTQHGVCVDATEDMLLGNSTNEFRDLVP